MAGCKPIRILVVDGDPRGGLALAAAPPNLRGLAGWGRRVGRIGAGAARPPEPSGPGSNPPEWACSRHHGLLVARVLGCHRRTRCGSGGRPTSRMFDMLFVLLVVIGIFGPLLFVRSWVEAIGTWMEKRPRLVAVAAKANGLRVSSLPVGRLLFNRWTAWVLLALLVVGTMLLLTVGTPLIMVLLVGPGVSIILLASLLDLSDELPEGLHLPHLEPGQVIAFLGVVIIVFLLVLGMEVLILGPDLRADGLHGVLAPTVLGFRARPVMVYDLDEKQEPLGALYLGGNADLYVLYDPCTELIRFVPVGSSRVELIDQVTCRSP
jgi:hypothetical protein